MKNKTSNAKDETEMIISESFSNDETTFEQLMQEIIHNITNGKKIPSDYCCNEDFGVKSKVYDSKLSFEMQAKRSV